jgi:RND family efflux transporter MFP subunit
MDDGGRSEKRESSTGGGRERKHRAPIALALAAGAALGCGRGGADAPQEPAVRPHEIASAAGPSELRYSAIVQAREIVPLELEVGGTVRRIAQRTGADGKPRPLRRGDFVRRGTELARLVDEDFRRRVARARAQRDGAAAALAQAEADAEHARKLLAAKSLTRVEYEAARDAAGVASSSLAAAETELESALTGLRDTVLHAPKDGLVLSRSIEVGRLAAPGTVAFVLEDVSEMKATFGVPERVARSLLVGQTMLFELEPGAEPVGGYVTTIAPSADVRSRVFDVEVRIANPDGRIRPGTLATVRVPAQGRPEGAGAAAPSSGVAVEAHGGG